jgi:hypothetical protein
MTNLFTAYIIQDKDNVVYGQVFNNYYDAEDYIQELRDEEWEPEDVELTIYKYEIDLTKGTKTNSKNVKKEYYIKYNVGKVKYCLHYYNGLKVHNDGSKFWDIETFSSKKKLNQSIKELKLQGYKEI